MGLGGETRETLGAPAAFSPTSLQNETAQVIALQQGTAARNTKARCGAAQIGWMSRRRRCGKKKRRVLMGRSALLLAPH